MTPPAGFTLAYLTDTLWLTLTSPPQGFARILALRPSAEARWLGLAIVAVLPVIQIIITTMGTPDAELGFLTPMLRQPVAGVILQIATLVIMSAAVAGIGQRFGGTARFADAMIVVIWVQFIMVCAQFGLMLLLPVSPALAFILSLVATAMFIRLLTHGTAYVNGFRSLPMVFAGIIATFILFVVVVGLVMAILGIAPDFAAGASHV